MSQEFRVVRDNRVNQNSEREAKPSTQASLLANVQRINNASERRYISLSHLYLHFPISMADMPVVFFSCVLLFICFFLLFLWPGGSILICQRSYCFEDSSSDYCCCCAVDIFVFSLVMCILKDGPHYCFSIILSSAFFIEYTDLFFYFYLSNEKRLTAYHRLSVYISDNLVRCGMRNGISGGIMYICAAVIAYGCFPICLLNLTCCFMIPNKNYAYHSLLCLLCFPVS